MLEIGIFFEFVRSFPCHSGCSTCALSLECPMSRRAGKVTYSDSVLASYAGIVISDRWERFEERSSEPTGLRRSFRRP